MVALAKEKDVATASTSTTASCRPRATRQANGSTRAGWASCYMINMTMWINNPNETSPWFHIRALHPHSLDVMRYLLR